MATRNQNTVVNSEVWAVSLFPRLHRGNQAEKIDAIVSANYRVA
jgi:hypothetical protein